ncbi:hypothetical protein A2J03_09880 [Rhodococcus sp. EPR-157]|uniref:DUF6011 domain-containing protein n=1 Tax=Rhodococcus sp. EPR-157 TaxID=1813677 RepID=UPI0007BBE1E8|nr:DUF6011 domain-containing protein [Rhodococcus sp. EPR-157]KZF00883.1 hypothetical protein A2J03_09880 [Rhodococcus sp. EPR-157]
MSDTRTDSTSDGPQPALLDDYLEKLRDPADKLLAAALRDGTFRLAVQCSRCGTWLVAPSSVKRHLGPVCARHAQAQAGVA